MDREKILSGFNQLIKDLSVEVTKENSETYKTYSKPLIEVINAKNEFLFCDRINDEYKKIDTSQSK